MMFLSSLLFLTMMVVSSTSAFLMMPPIMQHDAHHRSTTTLFYQDATEAPSTEPTTTLVVKQKPKSIWLESTALEKAVACAESADTCPVDELEDLANELDEYFHTCDIAAELEHCESEQEEREHILKILRLQAVLKRLTNIMSTTNKLVKTVKERRAEKVKNDWFTEYLEHYHL